MLPNSYQFLPWIKSDLIVLLKSDLDVQQTHLRPTLQSSLSWPLSHFVVLLKSDLDFQKAYLRGLFVEQKAHA